MRRKVSVIHIWNVFKIEGTTNITRASSTSGPHDRTGENIHIDNSFSGERNAKMIRPMETFMRDMIKHQADSCFAQTNVSSCHVIHHPTNSVSGGRMKENEGE